MAIKNQAVRPSALGMCIESTFRTVPITVITGSTYSVGIAATNPHRFRIVQPGSGFPATNEISNPVDELDGGIEPTRAMLVGKGYPGSVSFLGDGENMYEFLLGIFGRDVQTTLQGTASTSITPVYKHVFTAAKTIPSWTQEEIIGDGTYGSLTSGTVIESLEMDFGKVLQVKAGLHGYRQIPNNYLDANGNPLDYDFSSTQAVFPTQMGGNGTKQLAITAAPTYIDVAQVNNASGPFVWANLQYGSESGFSGDYLLINDASPGNVEIPVGPKLVPARKIDSFMVGGSEYDPGSCTVGELVSKLTMALVFKDNTYSKKAMAGAKFSMNFKLEGVYVGSSTRKYTLEIFIPNMRMTSPAPNLTGTTVMVNSAFDIKVDPAKGYAIKATLINSFTNASLAGTAGGAPGGPGGWASS